MVKMVLRKLSAAGLLVFTFWGSSCTLLEPGASVLKGNYLYQQGRYQDALLSYLEGRDTEKFSGRIQYNIGNVYYALGEGEAALGIWDSIDENRDSEVAFNTIFNKGVLHYQMGRYPEAYRSFRTALEMVPGNLDAKRNLELTIDRLEVENPTEENRPDKPTAEAGDDARRILQYIKRKEGSLWKSETSEPADTNDW